MRSRIKTTALAAVLLAGTAGIGAGLTNQAAAEPAAGKAKNVIYLLGDGMGRTHVTAGRERYYGADGKLNMETMPVVGQVSTYAIEKNSGQPGAADFHPNLVTDSASAATAWSSGVKTYNAALGIDAKGNLAPTVMEQAHAAGLATGNVSTAEITDATPAGQMSHALARGCQGPSYSASCQDNAITGTDLPTSDLRVTPIADQIARNQTADVILGGGLARFDAADETALKANGYTVLGSPGTQIVATESDLNGASGQKVFGLFNKGNLTVEKAKQDNPASPQALEPTVAEMTSKAISLLKSKSDANGGKGFYLQIEGALIDKRSHANDAAQTLEEIKAFDDAVKVALDFAKTDGNTLVIVTADHECAGFNIIEKGSFTNAEADHLPVNVDGGNTANNSTPSRPGNQAKDAGRTEFAPATFRTKDDPASVHDGDAAASLWLTYLSGNHTGADVPVFAYGPGSSAISAEIDNTDLFGIVRTALNLDGSATPAKAASTTAIKAPKTVKAGKKATVKVTVTPSAATGSVKILDKGKVIRTVTVAGSTVKVKIKLKKGKHKLKAEYAGSASYAPSTSPAVKVHVR